jgi:DNA repair photolyase
MKPRLPSKPDPLAEDRLLDLPVKGRGAVSNRTGRYEPTVRERVDDGWGLPPEEETRPDTRVSEDTSRTVIARNTSPDVGFDRSINPYRGCEHGCIYCFARPTHAFLGLSPGLDFETRILIKPEAAKLLEQELAKPGYRPAVIAMGTNTDPYQPLEKTRRITRSILEVLSRCNHPVGIVTKSALIQRDIDLLAPMAKLGLASATVSLTTLDPKLSRVMEPRAASPARRLETIRALSQAGIPTGVLLAPMIPALNDRELEKLLEAAADAGARTAGYVLLRLPLEIKELFEEWLEAHFPGRAKHILSLVRSMRDGKLYQSEFGLRQTGSGPYADLLAKRFRLAASRYGFTRRDWQYNASLFRPPVPQGGQFRLL